MRNLRSPSSSNSRRDLDSRSVAVDGMRAAIAKSRMQASRCSRRASVRYFSGRTSTRAENVRAAGAQVRRSDSSITVVNETRAGLRSTTARSCPRETWSRTRSPSPPSQPWRVE